MPSYIRPGGHAAKRFAGAGPGPDGYGARSPRGRGALKLAITDDVVDAHTRIVEPHGEVDMATAVDLDERLADVVAGGARFVIVDLADVAFLDSTALRVMLRAQRRLARVGGHLMVACPDPLLLPVFELTGLEEVLNVRESRDVALRDVRRLADPD